jgi:hypothetical protein
MEASEVAREDDGPLRCWPSGKGFEILVAGLTSSGRSPSLRAHATAQVGGHGAAEV